MLNPVKINFVPSTNSLVQGYDFNLFLEDGSVVPGGSFHVDNAHLVSEGDGTKSYPTVNFVTALTPFQNQNVFVKVNAYGPSGAESELISSVTAVFVFLDPPTNVKWL